ncbi:MAG: cob(I)yrinic acid a,c-diamide adenosyltransferase [Muribaculaceae bacterium]|nr:cob(I)yrinic acid a,c-diamide adenosyltransferase [Muribaculaceae bacterium]
MKVYTRTGDKGTTALIGGVRVAKDSVRLEAYGTVDELNSHIGLVCAIAQDCDVEMTATLRLVQNKLFNVGAYLATPADKAAAPKGLDESDIKALEDAIDLVDNELPPLQCFVLPGGCRQAAEVHIARTVCRRAERRIITLGAAEGVDDLVVKYINRLSDFLFVYARRVNMLCRGTELAWES